MLLNAAISEPERAIVEATHEAWMSDEDATWLAPDATWLRKITPTHFLTGDELTRWSMSSATTWYRTPDIVLFFKVMTLQETETHPLGEWLSFLPMSFNMLGVQRPDDVWVSTEAELMFEDTPLQFRTALLHPDVTQALNSLP
jgi:hypothetical protein